MIKLIIKETVLVKNLPQHIRKAVVEELTLDNPDYISRLKRGGYIGPEIPRYIYLYDALGDMLYTPRGYMNTLLSKIGTEEYEIIDRTVAPPITNDFNFTSVLRDYQQLATDDILARRYGLLEAGTGAGKCLGIGTPVLMFDGSIKNVEDVVVGELLMGPDSTKRTVKSVTTGKEQLYRVTPVKGDPYVVNESHILSLKITGNRPVSGYPAGSVANVDIKTYLAATPKFRHCAKGWRTGVEFPRVPTKSIITPYMLGIWLGDGNNANTGITTPDQEVVEEIYKFAERGHIGVREYIGKGHRCPQYYFSNGRETGGGDNKVLSELRRLNVINNKHVPAVFKVNSREIRLEILAGLMDTDGHLSHNGFDYITKDLQLAKDILFLARSVGLAAYMQDSWKKSQDWDENRLYYRISISGDCSIIPCRVVRKQAAVREQVKDVLRTGIKVDPIGVGNYYGFTIEGTDRLFLLGDFTVTHNTAMAIYVASIRKVKTLILVHNKELLNQWHDALRNHTDIKKIGTISGDKFDIQDVTVGIINSASNKIEQIMGTFGLLICDEGHRIVATSWITVINGLNCKYQLTLSATPYRRDGLTDAIFMLAGPKVHVVNKRYLEKTGAILVPDIVRCNTGFRYDYADDYTYMMTALCKDEQRNRMVVERIREEFVKYGEQIMVVSDRVSHCELLCEMLDGVSGMRPAVLSSKMTRDARKAVVAGMRNGSYNIILSTAALLGEGFDLNTLSALFIATPISFKGKLTQIVGRILRPTKSDHKPRVYDVRDVLIAVLANSGFRRDSEYKKLGWIS